MNSYETNYLSIIALVVLGSNLPDDSVYALTPKTVVSETRRSAIQWSKLHARRDQ